MNDHIPPLPATPTHKKRRLPRRPFIAFGLLLVFLGGSYLSSLIFLEVAPLASLCCVAFSTITTLKVEADWSRMVLDQSNSITVSITSTSALPSTGANQTAVVSNPTPVGTPNVPIEAAFGSGYEAFATVQLEAPAFEVSPSEPQTQSLEQPTVQFEWTVLPKASGPQVINVPITVQWKPKAAGEVIERPIGSTRLDTQVDSSALNLDSNIIIPTAVGAFATLTGAAIALLPWFIDQREKQKQKQRNKNRAKRVEEKPRTPPSKPTQTGEMPPL